jgi:hypothetical protein
MHPLLIAALLAQAAPEPAPTPETGDLDPALFAAVKAGLAEMAERVPGIRLLADAELRSEMKRSGKVGLLEALVLRCGNDIACIADLGRSVGAREVLLVRVEPAEAAGAPPLFKLLVVDNAGAMLRKLKLDLPEAAAVAAALEPRGAEIFGAAPAARVAVPETPPAALEAPPALTNEVPWWRDRDLWRWGGYGAAGAGVLSLAIASVLGVVSQSAASDIGPETRQPDTAERMETANDYAFAANTGFIVSAVFLAVGGGMIAWERYDTEWLVTR